VSRAAQVFALILAGALPLTVACKARPRPELRGIADPAQIPHPFAPASLILHPLTRIDRDAEGRLWIVAYLEVKDAWGDPTKAVGALTVMLYRQVGGADSTLGEHELTWDVNLADLDRNHDLYDSATRMYRLPLEKAPEWLATPPDGGRERLRGRLRAILATHGPRGEPVVLEDELTIGG
jgi:hypothetical protein